MMHIAAATTALTAVLFGLPGAASADDYPERQVSLIVPSAPGGTTDFSARVIAEGLSKALGKPVVVDNKPGASGNIGNAAVARAKPDGYTLLLSYSGYHVGNPALFKQLNWHPVKDFTPIAQVAVAPHVVLVPATSSSKTLQDLIARAKREPDKVNYASSGPGSIQHIGTELLKQMTGTSITHVPYKGAGPAMTDLLQDRVQIFITTPPSAIGHIQSGKIRALAIASKTRHPMLPDVPTSAEAGLPGFELDAWFAVFGPAGMPADVTQRLTSEIKKIMATPEYQARMEKQGTYARYLSPAELGTAVQHDLAYWDKVVKNAGINLD
jgi:tripartite-type tricarboxylate transporter receptor subunit TctC